MTLITATKDKDSLFLSCKVFNNFDSFPVVSGGTDLCGF